MNELIINTETGEETLREWIPEEIEAWNVAQLDQAWKDLRYERNRLLTESDWTVLGDSPTPTAAWKAYRQQLRDLPQNTENPFAPVWPTPPS
jgi:hypothetical protein